MIANEAKDYIIKHCNPNFSNGKTEWDQAMSAAVNALEKQIPKKPIRIDKNRTFDGNWKMICPTCEKVLMERITTPQESYPIFYNRSECCLCGQALDWSEE